MRPARLRAALIAAGVLVLAGCGDSKSGETDPTADSTTSAAQRVLAQDVRHAELAARAAPRDAQALARLIRLRFQAANASGAQPAPGSGAAGEAQLRRAATDWSRYLALNPPQPDVQLASLMVQAFGDKALNDPREAVRAQQIIVAQRSPPQASLYAQLALLHYRAQQQAAGDRAAARAVRLSPLSERAPLRRQLRQLRSAPASPGP